MMPNLGQGGCQAIEDAYVLTEQLCDVTDKAQIPSALQEYYRQRIVRSAIVQGMSRCFLLFFSDSVSWLRVNNYDLKYKNKGKTLNFLFCLFYMLTTLYANIFISLFIFGIIWSMVGIIFKMWICQQSISLYHCFVVIVVVNTLSVGSAATSL